ncbi:MAG: molybdenum cofactor guanylyltransferase [Phycisphaerales bacterium]|jgi:molybdopterin-guanine dinucleotide biosynthesis protein A|nr:molybdenum cofactor guanylyltransferase [Phycisphaerales bacterium]
MWPHTVAILIGGKSSRMGTPKHEVTLRGGTTMLEAMRTFASETAKHTIIVGGAIEGQQCVQDLKPGLGPVAGIEALLSSNHDDRYLVVGCDMPLLTTQTAKLLFTDGDAVVFSGDSKNAPFSALPLVISSHCKHACSAYLESGGRSLRGFLQEIVCRVVPRPMGVDEELSSINTPEQLNNCAFE